jgi:hypothetical protein
MEEEIMENIVSPWLFYLLGIIPTLKEILGVGAGISAFALIIYCIGVGVTKPQGNESDYKDWTAGWKPFRKSLIVVFVVMLPLAIFLPNKNTLITMYVADKVTYNTVQGAVDAGKSIKDELKKDIIEIIHGIEKEEKK